MRKKLEKIGEKLGYKYIRYCIPYRITCWKYRDKINRLKSILSDEQSVKTLNACMKSYKTRNYKYIQEVYDKSFERNYADLFGDIDKGYGVCDSSQYFPDGIIKLSDEEVFIDGGGYIGDTTVNFVKKTNNKFKKIHIFEALKDNFDKIPKVLNLLSISQEKLRIWNEPSSYADDNKSFGDGIIELHKVGLYSSEQDVLFNNNTSSARPDKHGKTPVKLIALDSYLSEAERQEITYIKLDIEGSEMEALKGMSETISKYKPKLAICIYHKPADLWELPLFIKELNPSYKLYIRQHHPVHETVCYAI
jgi:FkbM family methyltransferase